MEVRVYKDLPRFWISVLLKNTSLLQLLHDVKAGSITFLAFLL